MPIGPTLEVQEDLQVILTGVEDNTQEILDGERGDITVSSSGNVWTVNKNAILNKTTASAVGTDYILISDTSDSGNVKKALASDLIIGVSDGDKGDITVSSAGTVWSIDNNAVVEAKINTGAVTETKIADSAVTENKIANNAVTVNKIANDSVTNSKLANMATATVKGRATAGTGDPEDLAIDNDLASVSANDDTIPSAKAVKAYVDLLELKTRIRNAGLINGFIRVTVASNNLTVAVSTSPTSQVDPTASNPVYVWIGGVLRSITSSLTFTRNGGTSSLNMGSAELATREVDLFPYLQWNTTTSAVNLLASRIPYARKMSNFVNSATDEKGALGIVNYNSNDDVVLVDRFSATSNSSNNFTATGNVYGEPIYETRYLSYTPTLSGSGGSIGTFTANPYDGQYQINNRKVHNIIKIKCTNVGSWSGNVIVKTPLTGSSDFPNENPAFGFVAANGANPATANKGIPILSFGSYIFLTAVDVGALTWGTFVVNDHIRINAHYYI